MDPITREEMYLAAAAGYAVEPPEPITRKEVFLAKLAGMDVETPAPFTRRERFIEEAAMAENNAVIEPLQVTENGTYTAPSGVDGYNPVTVDVPAPEIKLQDKTITENGEYTADEGFDGLGKVTVEVKGSGGALTPGCYWEMASLPDQKGNPSHFVYNGDLYCAFNVDSGNYYDFYKYINGNYEVIATKQYMNTYAPYFVEYDGKIHVYFGGYSHHLVFDGQTVTNLNNFPFQTNSHGVFVHNNHLFMYNYKEGYIYQWDSATDTWKKGTVAVGNSYESASIVVVNNQRYMFSSGKIYLITDAGRTLLLSSTNCKKIQGYSNNCVYASPDSSGCLPIYKYDVTENVESFVGTSPFTGVNYSAYFYNNTLRIEGGANTLKNHMILHEVTE